MSGAWFLKALCRKPTVSRCHDPALMAVGQKLVEFFFRTETVCIRPVRGFHPTNFRLGARVGLDVCRGIGGRFFGLGTLPDSSHLG